MWKLFQICLNKSRKSMFHQIDENISSFQLTVVFLSGYMILLLQMIGLVVGKQKSNLRITFSCWWWCRPQLQRRNILRHIIWGLMTSMPITITEQEYRRNYQWSRFQTIHQGIWCKIIHFQNVGLTYRFISDPKWTTSPFVCVPGPYYLHYIVIRCKPLQTSA